MAVGGGTRVWQGMAWRFLPEDFEMATRYGVPDGSTLADWPIGYDDLAPYYDRVEWEIGVSGASSGPLDRPLARMRGVPDATAARRPDPGRVRRRRRPARVGWGPVPFAINSVPRDGRAACVRCSQCLGHASPVNAKNGTHNTVIPRAVATGNCDLAGGRAGRGDRARRAARARRVVVDVGGRSSARVRCGRVVVCAGAVETPRLLLVSGLGNAVVGTNLHNHSFAMLYGTPASRSSASRVPATRGDAGLRAPRRRGLGRRRALRRAVAAAGRRRAGRRVGTGVGRGPQALDARRPAPHRGWHGDRPGDPVLALARHADPASRRARHAGRAPAGEVHPATAEVREYMRAALHVAGRDRRRAARRLRPGRPPAAAGEHSAGTCRMGEDPATSACDRDGRVHGTENVYVADASLLPPTAASTRA